MLSCNHYVIAKCLVCLVIDCSEAMQIIVTRNIVEPVLNEIIGKVILV